jgi:hypothetical protein
MIRTAPAVFVRGILFALFMTLFFCIPHARSSTLSLSNRPECRIVMSGAIEAGDSGKFSKFVSDNSLSQSPLTVCLEGPGGDYSELAPFIDVFFGMNVSTYVRANTSCFSACALLFMAGSYSESPGETTRLPSRRMDVTANLGFHAPYLDAKDLAVPPDKINFVYSLGVQAVASLLKRNEDGIFPTTLIVELLSKGPNEVILVDTVEKAGRWKISLAGYKMPNSIDLTYILNGCYAVSGWVDAISSTAPALSDAIVDAAAANTEKEAAELELGKTLFVSQYQNTTRFRITTGFGGEASYDCVVNIYRTARKFRIKVEYASLEKDDGTTAQAFNETATNASDDEDSFWSDVIFHPDWVGFEAQSKLPALSGTRDANAPPYANRIMSLMAQKPAPAAVTTQPRSFSAPTFTMIPNADLDGDLVARMPGSDVTSCANACTNNAACEAFTFDKWNGICFMKHDPQNRSLQAKAMSGIKPGIGPVLSKTTAIQLSRYHNKVFLDQFYKRGMTHNFDECQNSCEKDSKCVALSYKTETRLCALFETVNAYQDGPGVESAAKRQ